MSVRINYEYDAVTIPGKAVPALERAGATDIRLLMALCTRADLREVPETDLAAFATAIGCTEAQVAASFAFWRGVGVLVMDGSHERVSDLLHVRAEPEQVRKADAAGTETGAKPAVGVPTGGEAVAPAAQETGSPATPTAKTKGRRAKPERHDQLPSYTIEQINTLLEEHPDTASYISESQNVWGKIFNTHEINILLGLVDYLGLDWDYVLILLSYCRRLSERRGSTKSLHYVETVAFGFYDEGICDAVSLQHKLRQMELMAETEGQLRSLFGMGSRALSTTEKRYFSTWLYDYGYGMDIIRRAYEITVDAIGEPKVKYTNSILSSWNSKGLKTLDAVNAFVEASDRERGKGKGETARRVGSTFETDSFFAAALRRNFGDEEADPGKATCTGGGGCPSCRSACRNSRARGAG